MPGSNCERMEDRRHVSFSTDPWDVFLHRSVTSEKQYFMCVAVLGHGLIARVCELCNTRTVAFYN